MNASKILANNLSANTSIASVQANNKTGQVGKTNGKDQGFAAILSQLLGGNNKYNQAPEASGPKASNAATTSWAPGIDISA